MIDSIFKAMLDDGIVDYGVILQSWIGIPGINIKLKSQEIVDFAMNKINDSLNESEEKLLIDLTSAYLLDDIEITRILTELCNFAQVNINLSLRKWRLYLLKNILDNLENDSLYAFIRLGEFWIEWQSVLSDQIPHLYQGANNSISQQDYYSRENMDRVIDIHKEWIENEKKLLVTM